MIFHPVISNIFDLLKHTLTDLTKPTSIRSDKIRWDRGCALTKDISQGIVEEFYSCPAVNFNFCLLQAVSIHEETSLYILMKKCRPSTVDCEMLAFIAKNIEEAIQVCTINITTLAKNVSVSKAS